MTHRIFGDDMIIRTKDGNLDTVMAVSGNPLSFSQAHTVEGGISTNRISTLAAGDTMEFKAGATTVMSYNGTSIDFKNTPVSNLTTNLVTELGSDLTIENSLQIGTGSNAKIWQSSSNLQLDVPTGKYISLNVNGSQVAYMNATSFNIVPGTLYLGGANANITQSFGSMITRVDAGKTTSTVISGTTIWTTDSTGFSLGAGLAYFINSASVLNSTTLGSSVVNSSLTSVGTLVGLTSSGDIVTTNTTNATSTTTGPLRSAGGAAIAKTLYVGQGAVIRTLGATGTVSVDNSAANEGGNTSNACLVIDPGSTSNASGILQLESNYTGTVLQGFKHISSYGDNASGSNRNNSSYYFTQFVNSINGGAAINAHEIRMSVGSRREIRFSSTGSATNDFTLDGSNATFNINVALAASRSLTLSSDLAYKPGGGSWTTTSDERLKTNISLLSTAAALNSIKKIKIKQYNFVQPYCDKYQLPNTTRVGVMAQDLEEDEMLSPCVSTHEDEVFYEEKTETYVDDIDDQTKTRSIRVETHRVPNRKAVNMDRAQYLLIAAVQELTKQMRTMRDAIKERDTLIESLTGRLNAIENSYHTTSGVDVGDNMSYDPSGTLDTVG